MRNSGRPMDGRQVSAFTRVFDALWPAMTDKCRHSGQAGYGASKTRVSMRRGMTTTKGRAISAPESR
jgi:hypothetical protein